MKTATVVSAGGIVFDDAGRVVLVSRLSPAGVKQWTLPKGLVEKGEAPEQAALREVREEAGLDAEIVRPAGTIDYWFVWKPDDTRYHKFVHYFVMRATGGDVSQHDDEVVDAAWFEPNEAVAACSFANERDMVSKAVASWRA